MPLKYNMRLIASFILVFVLALPAFSQNVVLINGSVIDGTGKARALGSLRIRDGKIADVGVFKLSPGETLIDVKGMIIAPGFVWRPLRHAYGGNTDRSVDRYGGCFVWTSGCQGPQSRPQEDSQRRLFYCTLPRISDLEDGADERNGCMVLQSI